MEKIYLECGRYACSVELTNRILPDMREKEKRLKNLNMFIPLRDYLNVQKPDMYDILTDTLNSRLKIEKMRDRILRLQVTPILSNCTYKSPDRVAEFFEYIHGDYCHVTTKNGQLCMNRQCSGKKCNNHKNCKLPTKSIRMLPPPPQTDSVEFDDMTIHDCIRSK
tara:strand:- start:4088 stop:4582 length:495 start_codon:yes stop_codon:yes gene_type:complete